MSEARLRALQRECVVQVDRDDAPAGSGFLAAPGYIISCAHVPRRAEGETVTGQWRGTPWAGKVVYTSPPPRDGGKLWPEPDLAVIRLDSGLLDGHPCVRLAGQEPALGSRMVAAGRRMPFENDPADFASVTLEYTGITGYLMRLGNERFGPGISGGPVLDLSTGNVCGVAKLAGPDGDGYAVPVYLAFGQVPGLLPAHDRYHATHPGWVHEQEDLWQGRTGADRPVLPPDYEAELFGLLANLPAASEAELSQLREECAGTVLDTQPGTAADLRDLALRLSRLSYDPVRPHSVIILAELLARRNAGSAATLTRWSGGLAERKGQWQLLAQWRERLSARPGPAPATATEQDPFAAVVMLTPDADRPHAYRTAIWRNRGTTVKIDEHNDAAELPSIIASLRQVLPRVLGELPGPNKIVEFILPFELFDEPVHEWQVFREEYMLLGKRYPVVIRDLDRFDDLEDRSHAEDRWANFSQHPDVTVEALTCADPRTPGSLYDLFENNKTTGALGVPGPALRRNGLFQAALNAGVRVAIWRLGSCPAASPQDCQSCEFRNALNAAISGHPVYRLPQLGKETRAAGSLSDLGLLWDNPLRAPLPRGLAVHWTG